MPRRTLRFRTDSDATAAATSVVFRRVTVWRNRVQGAPPNSSRVPREQGWVKQIRRTGGTISTVFPYRSTNPTRSARASPHRVITLSIEPGLEPDRSTASNASRRSRGPSATTSTRPSGRFVALPTKPSSSARARTHHRMPTPCTRPRSHSTRRSRSCSWPPGSLTTAAAAGPAGTTGRCTTTGS